MKAFVYDKKTSKKVVEIKNVVDVMQEPDSNTIYIVDNKKRLYQYNIGEVKTTIYQN